MTQVRDTVLSGPGGEVAIGDEHPFRIIGERINPTGRSGLSAELQAMDMIEALSRLEAQDEPKSDATQNDRSRAELRGQTV